MNAWAYDENAIQLLKTLIPRKGELKRPPSQSQLTIKCKFRNVQRFKPYSAFIDLKRYSAL